MNEDRPNSFWKRLSDWFDNIKLPFNRFFLFLALILVLAGIMGLIGFRWYRLSDAANLDLSRQEYQTVREATNDTKSEPKIAVEGLVDQSFKQEVLQDLKYYYEQLSSVKAFSEEPLLDENLSLIDTAIN